MHTKYEVSILYSTHHRQQSKKKLFLASRSMSSIYAKYEVSIFYSPKFSEG